MIFSLHTHTSYMHALFCYLHTECLLIALRNPAVTSPINEILAPAEKAHCLGAEAAMADNVSRARSCEARDGPIIGSGGLEVMIVVRCSRLNKVEA
jgi:hypothetical protein